jgi:hypothetical protein
MSYKICNISAEFAQTYSNRFNKPYFQPDFPTKTTLVVAFIYYQDYQFYFHAAK